jgi:hypothetical protein
MSLSIKQDYCDKKSYRNTCDICEIGLPFPGNPKDRWLVQGDDPSVSGVLGCGAIAAGLIHLILHGPAGNFDTA